MTEQQYLGFIDALEKLNGKMEAEIDFYQRAMKVPLFMQNKISKFTQETSSKPKMPWLSSAEFCQQHLTVLANFEAYIQEMRKIIEEKESCTPNESQLKEFREETSLLRKKLAQIETLKQNIVQNRIPALHTFESIAREWREAVKNEKKINDFFQEQERAQSLEKDYLLHLKELQEKEQEKNEVNFQKNTKETVEIDKKIGRLEGLLSKKR